MKAFFYSSIGVTVIIFVVLSIINFVYLIKSIEDYKKYQNLSSNITDYNDCKYKLENYIINISIATIAIPASIGGLFILTCLIITYCCAKNSFLNRKKLFKRHNHHNHNSSGSGSVILFLIFLGFIFVIGWPFVAPLMTILYWYGYFVLEKCVDQINNKNKILNSIFDGFKNYYLICSCVCSIGSFIMIVWIISLIIFRQRIKTLLN